MTEVSPRPSPVDFRDRLARRDRLFGTFIKTPTSHTSEIIGDIGYDFVIIDEEHAPFDRVTSDQALLGARAAGAAGFVRVPDVSRILGALDDGAVGVMVPHIDDADKAKELVAYARYRPGRRGFSNSPRAGRYGGRTLPQHVAYADAQTTIVAMIEDAKAVENISGIVAVEGLDAIFIGRADLTLSLGVMNPTDAIVQDAVERICSAAVKAGMPIWVPATTGAERDAYARIGASVFVVATDQAFLRSAAMAALKGMKG
jgi:2-keto-3-deoxy-L-rhamnonate aldolase RhmA